MNEQIRGVDPMPSWLVVRYIAVAAELERLHGAIFATEFLRDVGITPDFDSGDSERADSFYVCSRTNFAGTFDATNSLSGESKPSRYGLDVNPPAPRPGRTIRYGGAAGVRPPP
jgi:hypothetical protein